MKRIFYTFLICCFFYENCFAISLIGSGIASPVGPTINDDFSTDTSANYIITETTGDPATVGVSGGKLHWTGQANRNGNGYHSTVLSSTNHYVQGKILIGSGYADYSFLQARHDGSTTCYRLRFNGEGSTWIRLERVIAGSASFLDSYTLSAVVDQEYNIRITVSGTGATVNILVAVDGVDRIDYDDTDGARIVSGSYVGFGFKESSGDYDATIDDFIADEL